MVSFLTEAGKRVAARWFTQILLPGLLLAAIAVSGWVLGHAHAFDVDRLASAAERGAGRKQVRLAVEVAVVVVGAGVAGTLARGLGTAVRRFWLRERALLAPRLRRARAVEAAKKRGAEPVAAYLPARPTWLSDRLRLVEVRVRAQYWFSAALAWPRIWLLTSEEFHAPVRNARARFDDACALAGWAVLYLVVGVFWWPAVVVAVVAFVVAWRRARVSLEEFATLVEAAIDVRWRDLAEALGIAVQGESPTPAEGALIDDRLRKGS
ncbi:MULTISPECIES: hypothetical protein [Amycolatopsis]|uniref:Uncharacterized protein n=1 Tax=Amycolatopsis dongchuanensis TaxID=1070866 RepID=A0ABP8VHL0_9PSEU